MKKQIELDAFDYAGFAGVLCMVVGLWWIWPPLALLTFGAALTYLSYKLSAKCRS